MEQVVFGDCSPGVREFLLTSICTAMIRFDIDIPAIHAVIGS